MAAKRITEAKAKRVLAAVRAQFKSWIDADVEGPVLIMDWQPEYGDNRPAIVWEGGPAAWAILVNGGGREEEFGIKVDPAKLPAGVFCEPYYSYVLCIYPA